MKLSNGMEMPEIGLGLYLLEKGKETQDAVTLALKQGYRLFDGASFYDNEADLGIALAASDIPRDEISVITKVWTTDRTYEDALSSVRRSHRELGGKYPIDLAFVHWPVPGHHTEQYRALVTAHQEGLIKSIGISNYSPEDFTELQTSGVMSTVAPVVHQYEASPFIQRPEMATFFRSKGIALQATKPLQRGARLESPAVLQVAEKYKCSPAQVLLKYGVQKGFSVLWCVHDDTYFLSFLPFKSFLFSSPSFFFSISFFMHSLHSRMTRIVGLSGSLTSSTSKSRSESRLAENIAVLNLSDFSDEDMTGLDALDCPEYTKKIYENYVNRKTGTPAPWGDGPRPSE